MFLHKSSSKPQCKGVHDHVRNMSAAAAVIVLFQVGKLACLAGYATSNIGVEKICSTGLLTMM